MKNNDHFELSARETRAEWITGSYVVPAEHDYAAHFADAPAPVLRRRFVLPAKPVASAVWRIASPGMRDAFVNGTRVTATALPLWTAYDRRVLEDEFDVAALLRCGEDNCLSLELGNGWWNPLPMKMWGRYNLRDTLAHGTPAVRATLDIAFADGTHLQIVTDGSWEAANGPVLRNNIYLGERLGGDRQVAAVAEALARGAVRLHALEVGAERAISPAPCGRPSAARATATKSPSATANSKATTVRSIRRHRSPGSRRTPPSTLPAWRSRGTL